jgi:ribosomal protein L7Ae-like RNA K-turn-binding protein
LNCKTLDDHKGGLKMLGLASKGGFLVYGENVETSIKKSQSRIVFVATDLSPKRRHSLAFCALLTLTNVIVIPQYSKDELSNSVGKKNVGLLSIKDYHMAAYFKNAAGKILVCDDFPN